MENNNWNTWDTRPAEGARIELQMAHCVEVGTYFDGGADGLVEFDDGDCMEVEEYENTTKWRLLRGTHE